MKERWSSYINFKVNSRTRKIIRDEEGHSIVVKGSNLQGDIILHANPNNRASKYTRQKQIDLKGYIGNPLLEVKSSISSFSK